MTLMEQVLQQLTAELTNFSTVVAAWTSKPLANFDEDLPAALVYLDGVESEASPYMNETIQPGDYRVAVLIVCPAVDLETRQAEVRAALAGFQPTGDSWDVFEHLSGNMVEINESIVWWRDLYAARNYQQ